MPTTQAAIPEELLAFIESLVTQVRINLERDNHVQAVAFVGSSLTRQIQVIAIDCSSGAAKEASGQHIRKVAQLCDADFVLSVTDAWMLRADKSPQYKAILAKYGSIGQSPYRVDCICFVLESLRGNWMAQAPCVPKGHSKVKRTFASVDFEPIDRAEGNLAGFLPRTPPRDMQH